MLSTQPKVYLKKTLSIFSTGSTESIIPETLKQEDMA